MARKKQTKQAPLPSGQVLEEPQVWSTRRVGRLYSPSDLQSAEYAADAGNFRSAAGMCDAMMANDRVRQLLNDSLIGGMLSLPFSFEDDIGDPVGKAKYQEQISEDWKHIVSEAEAVKIIGWGLFFGLAIAQKIWLRVNGRTVPRLRFWHPSNAGWDQKTRQFYVLDAAQQRHFIELGSPDWFVFTPYGESRPWASGLWRGIGPWWLLASYAVADYGRTGERVGTTIITKDVTVGGGGMRTGTSSLDVGTGALTASKRQALVVAFQSAGRDAAIEMPPGWDAKILDIANTGAIFREQIELAHKSMAISILGNNLSTQVDGGSLAAAKSHADKELDRQGFVGRVWSTEMRNGVLVDWSGVNFADPEYAPWPLWNSTPPEDLGAKVEVLDKGASGLTKMQALGFELEDEDDIEAVVGFKFKRSKVLPEQKPEPPGGPPQDDPNQPKQQARARFLASGDDPEEAQGFIDGQRYADSLIDSLIAEGGNNALRVAMLEAVEGAETLEEIPARLRAAYDSAGLPDDQAELIQRAMVLAALAGRYAVSVDAK